MSLRPFIFGRREVKIIRSDNGINFVGAEKELKSCIRNLDQNKINSFLGHCHIKRIFNPHVSPWMGGSWESLVRSVKCALKVIVHDRPFTEESQYTFFCEIETLLNSRPFTRISDDPNDHNALTTNHILLYQESNNYSPDNLIDDKINLRKNGQLSRQLQICFGDDG